MDSMLSFFSSSTPTYTDLFQVRHSENQALLLFENYLCYRALLDILSLRSSLWEQLVNVVFSHVKDTVDEECKRWLCCVHLGMLIREAIQHSSYENFCNVFKCLKCNSGLFPKKAIHKELTNQLSVSIACYCLVVEKDKDKAAELCNTDNTILKLIDAFPDFSVDQNEFMHGQSPHTALIKILDNLRCAVMKMPPPVLVEMFDEYWRATQEQDDATDMIGPQTRSKAAAARQDGSSAEVAVKIAQSVAKSPRKLVSTTGYNKKDDATDDGTGEASNSGPKTITSFYSLRGKRQPKSPAKLKSPKRKSQSTPTKQPATPTKSPSSKAQSTPSKLLPAPSNTRLTPSRSHLTPTKPRPAKSPSKLITHAESEQPAAEVTTYVVESEEPAPEEVGTYTVVVGYNAEDDEVAVPQSTPNKKRKVVSSGSSSDSVEAGQPTSTVQQSEDVTKSSRPGLRDRKETAVIVESSSDAEEAEQPTSTVQQSEDAKKKFGRRRLRDLKETGDVSNSWSDGSISEESDESDFAALPRGIKVKHRRRDSLALSPKLKKFRFSTAIRHPWTHHEAQLLVEGVERFGLGHWAAILKHYKFPAYRDNVSLKDKWRNMKKNHELPDKFL